RVGFDPSSFQAAALDGAPVALDVQGGLLAASFPAPLVTGTGSYNRIEVDFDLLASLTGDVASGSLTLAPSGSAFSSPGDDGIAVDEIKGTVLAANAAAATLLVDAFADGDLAAPLGQVHVNVTPSTLLIDDDGFAFPGAAAFFGSLILGTSLLEVHGNLVAGAITATKIEVEDSFGSGGNVVAELRGKVVSHAPGVGFGLLWKEIEKGASVVAPALAALGNPATVQVAITPQTIFYLDDDSSSSSSSSHQIVSEAALAVGQEVKVKFLQFGSSPFPAFKVEIEHPFPEFEGFLADLSGLPGAFVMKLQSSQPAIWSGQVASSNTPVLVEVGSAKLLLKVDGKPALTTSDLSLGLKVEVYGTLSGPPTGPTLAAHRIEVHAGRLDDAAVVSKSPGTSSFTTVGGEVKDPFGAGVTGGALNVVLEPGCVFDGDASSKAAFFALGGSVEVEVEGLASGTPSEIRAFVVKSKD
ncbi:MAG TPA: hypothetical protein VJP77_00415, partial [Planctomycetota bacterium]|nr:hypothetical protein [Planctomycetota bacterium]